MSPRTNIPAEEALDPEIFRAVAPVLRTLGHPDRLRILELLMRRSVPVSEIAESLELAANAVSQHLTMMQARGVVERRRRGRQVFYAVVHPAARSLLQCMRRNAAEICPVRATGRAGGPAR